MSVHVVDHPLIRERLSALRDSTTEPSEFRHQLRAVGRLMVFDVTRDLETVEARVQTPMEPTIGFKLARPIVLVPILRAGLGMAEGLQQLLPEAAFGHIGLARNEETLKPDSYYCNLPKEIGEADVFLVDPMLATGGSAIRATQLLIEKGATRLRFVNLVSAPEGIERYEAEFPEIPIFTAAIDRGLNEIGYIVPGLGDAGDRYFGTL
ncbi:MAG: uracil phosphoribosyltransferase [Verrucomicrobiales bacterium]|jgi:uracil phosphoribosyltransferase